MQDFLPVLAFVGAYVITKWMGYPEQAMFVATAVIMVVTLLQILWMRLSGKIIEKRHWLTLAVVWIFGGITLIVHDELFIKLKPTVLNVAIAAVFLGSQFVGKENLTKKMLHAAFDMPERLWVRLNIAWVIFFLLEGGLNIIVALKFSNDVYVSFKFWGLMVLTFLFMATQFWVLRKYLRKDLS
ncbi:inner membrane-spanning protein YciB [Suttonella ornithocola]|uniref:Inner membrane-spanning protein YciB n=1 Tax=Suttonella ornithocola TaxID=279832 RepID=A0A380MLB1_9GAMM|nr:inner membrane-spanning protein YciB [Suttonella ornithocola]SUO93420.1 Intracellular septation protein [Suttonella ornithocola]